MKNTLLTISITLNILLLITIGYGCIKILNGCAEMPDGRIGVLNQDLNVGYFDSNQKLFTLPKELVVREASATGAGWFEPYRFRIIITSSNDKLVNYKNTTPQELSGSEYYSADIDNN